MKQRREFQKLLENLQQNILKMGGLVEENIARTIDSLVKQNIELAEEVFKVERLIDDMELEIEEMCMLLIATQQPMASDLRRIAAGFKIIADLERMGDYAVDIAKITVRIAGEPLIKALIDLPRMRLLVQKMVHDSLDSYVKEDERLAYSVGLADDEVDHLHKQIFRELLLMMIENPRVINQATYLLFVSRYLERIADHATNIAERVIYLASGKRVELND